MICLFMVLNNMSVILWRSALLEEKTTNLTQVTDKLNHIMLYQFEYTQLLMNKFIGSGCYKRQAAAAQNKQQFVSDCLWRKVKIF
jgi:hypothetical protein